ncbi:DE-cadherin isoform X1 [Microplitis mediator]|uniref:DE-cadherin isoform X1 n=1 Tax=Microplitis mediator TaxID=375433 RepID=UPI0025549CDA|nr:DE-cadherin isoform X1 [Microplitis mediator]
MGIRILRKARLRSFGIIIESLWLFAIFCGTLEAANLRHTRQADFRSQYFNIEDSVTKDDNHNHKPVFYDCLKLAPRVKEDEPAGTIVITVHAEDRDPPDEGGTITYSFVTAPGEKLKFEINNVTGLIKTTQVLDRDEPAREKEAYLTVLATDNGRPQLDDVCTFKVTIEDVNDNAPVFDKVVYTESVPQDHPPNAEVMRVSATDIDDGNNSVIQYSLTASRNTDDASYFKIDEKTGVIYLSQAIKHGPDYKFRLIARAQDLGRPEPKASEIDLEIRVVDSYKKAPTFLGTSANTLNPLLIPENFTGFDLSLVQVTAASNIPDNPNGLIFELVTGGTEQANKANTFRLESEGNTAHIKLAQHLDYERVTEYTLIVRVQNNYDLAAETVVNIQVLDVNDNIPVFVEMKKGSVLENELPGVPVMQVRAIDHDGTEANNQVTYELDNYKDYFAIDKYTGNITTLTTFDREKVDTYNVKIIATDNSPSALYKTGEPNRGQQDFRIEIADKNDNPPHFNRSVYTANSILENTNVNALVTEVKADDNDTASPVIYSIIAGNADDSFYIEGTTGKIRIKRPLDYEKITEYNLTVRAFDGMYADNATVKIFIENVNDNPPIFTQDFDRNPTIEEEKLIDGCLTQVSAYDPDIKNRSADQHIAYFIVKEDQQPLLEISKTGCIKLKKPLDRDPPTGYPMWTVIVMARDEDGAPTALQALVMVNITLIDINDNAPFLDMIQPVVWYENQQPDNITKLRARDFDSDENGPPFHFSIDPAADNSIDLFEKFSIIGDDLRANVVFDREECKQYELPIVISDSGRPRSMTGTSTLTIVIGDENDNRMEEGTSSIFVYNYKNKGKNQLDSEDVIQDTEIGRVYVNDLDDWDLPDKYFSWLDGGDYHEGFSLDPHTGMITMLSSNTWVDNTYLLKFVVKESSPLIPSHTVNAYVNVTVKLIPEEAVVKSGSIRFYGSTPEEFVAPRKDSNISKKDIFHERLATILNTTIDNIDVFTVLVSPHQQGFQSKDTKKRVPLLDVRFSAHGSPYYAAEKLNTIVSRHAVNIERELEMDIMMVSIDECLQEQVHCNNSCRNYLNISGTRPYVVYTNLTSFVGVRAIVDPQCTCHVAEPIVCLNGGTPLLAGTPMRSGEIIGTERCECPPGLEGPRCELLDIAFHGDGWAVMPALEKACDDSHLGVELKTFNDFGLVFYIGPMIYSKTLGVQDFMSLEIQNGYPVLYVNYGSGTVRLEQTQTKLSDGKEHRIDIYWTKSVVEMKIDNCGGSNCMSLGGPPGDNDFLNVNSPVQIGGNGLGTTDFHELSTLFNWTFTPTDRGFYGCIRNMTINGNTYNFGNLALAKNAYAGCDSGMAKAVSFSLDTNFWVVIAVCLIILFLLVAGIFAHRRRSDEHYKDMDDIRENIINYEDEGGGEVDTGYDLNVLRRIYDSPSVLGGGNGGIDSKLASVINQGKGGIGNDEIPDICSFLDGKKSNCDKDPDINPFDDVRHYAYEGDGNSDGSLSSLASCTDDGDLKFNYLSNFGPRFRKLADMYGEEPSDDDDDDDEDDDDNVGVDVDNDSNINNDACRRRRFRQDDNHGNNSGINNDNRPAPMPRIRNTGNDERESESWC